MKLAVTITRSLQADMQAEVRDLDPAAAAGTKAAGRGLKTELRRQVASAGLGQRLARAWRDRHYDNRGLDAASLIYTKAPQIIRALDEGAVIRAKRGRFLAESPEFVPIGVVGRANDSGPALLARMPDGEHRNPGNGGPESELRRPSGLECRPPGRSR